MTERTCNSCGVTKPLDYDHWSVAKRDLETGEPLKFCSPCRACANAKQRERAAKRTAEERAERAAYQREMYEIYRSQPGYRERQKMNKRAWRRTPEGRKASREQYQRYMERLRQDPEKFQRHLELRRITERLRRERATGQLGLSRHKDAIGKYQYRHIKMPLEPFALWVDEVLNIDPRDFEDIAEVMEIPARRLYDYRERKAENIALPSAEKAIERYGRPVRIHSKRVEARLAQLEDHWRNAPGNGTRILGYLQAAEPIIPLAGAVIVTAEDLWPS